VVVRLSPTVHGERDYGFMARIIGIAREKGVSGYIGDGSNQWPAVHVIDAAQLFRLAVEHAPAGSVLHAVADEGVPLRDTAEVVGRRLNIPVTPISPNDAPAHFSWLAGFIGMNSPASSAHTRELLKWQPTQPGLIEDLNKGHYFDRPAADKY
jgi:nucleoside-diphosphate-sugar epimerase